MRCFSALLCGSGLWGPPDGVSALGCEELLTTLRDEVAAMAIQKPAPTTGGVIAGNEATAARPLEHKRAHTLCLPVVDLRHGDLRHVMP